MGLDRSRVTERAPLSGAASRRDCPECGRFEDYLMEDGSWICHKCGHVEFPELGGRRVGSPAAQGARSSGSRDDSSGEAGQPGDEARAPTGQSLGASTSRAWFTCPSCAGACRRLHEGVCPGCHYVLTGGDQGEDYRLTWEARIDCPVLPETNWWCV
jgi:ribosomal protein L37AE/L43A